MAEFKYYLNRQGVRGPRGEKGDQGFSPIITEKTNTSTEYILHVQNENEEDSFDTANLKEGLVPEDLGGTTVRYNRTTGKQYYGEIDNATEEVAGLVKLTKDEELLNPSSETSVLTAKQALDNYASSDRMNVAEQAIKNIQSVDKVVMDIDQPTDGTLHIMYSDLKGGFPATKDITISSSAGGDVTKAGDNVFTGDNFFRGELEANSMKVVNGLYCADVQAPLEEGGSVPYLKQTDVDGQTVQVVDGKLHANIDELGNEVNELSGRVTANEADIATLNTEMTDVTGDVETLQTTVNGQVTDINILKTSMQNKQNKLVAGDNITLTNNSDGTTTVASTGGGGGITTLDFIDGGNSRTSSTVVTLFSAGSSSVAIGNNETNTEVKEVE